MNKTFDIKPEAKKIIEQDHFIGIDFLYIDISLKENGELSLFTRTSIPDVDSDAQKESTLKFLKSFILRDNLDVVSGSQELIKNPNGFVLIFDDGEVLSNYSDNALFVVANEILAAENSTPGSLESNIDLTRSGHTKILQWFDELKNKYPDIDPSDIGDEYFEFTEDKELRVCVKILDNTECLLLSAEDWIF